MIKLLFVVMLVAALAFGANDGCTDSSIGIDPGTSGSDAVALTVINDWTQTEQVLGLEIWESSSITILGSDRANLHMVGYNSSTGAPTGVTLPYDSGNTNCFGIVWNNNTDTEVYYTNDWSVTHLYETEDFGVSWASVTSPNGSQARGMDFDGTDYWCTNADGGGLWRFQPGVGQENIAIPEVPTQPSGLAVFPYGGNIGIAVTTYNTHNIYFYEWDGAAISYLGSAACPVSGISSSYGLTYADLNGHLYWSFSDGSNYHIAEISFTITALERSSWGSIKTSF